MPANEMEIHPATSMVGRRARHLERASSLDAVDLDDESAPDGRHGLFDTTHGGLGASVNEVSASTPTIDSDFHLGIVSASAHHADGDSPRYFGCEPGVVDSHPAPDLDALTVEPGGDAWAVEHAGPVDFDLDAVDTDAPWDDA